MAIRKHNDVLKYGKDVIRSKSIQDKIDAMAKLNLERQKTRKLQEQVEQEKSSIGTMASISYDNIFSKLQKDPQQQIS